MTRAGGFTGVDGTYRLLADGTAERALAILEVQKIGAGIIEAPPALGAGSAAGAPGPATSGLAAGLFNFLNN